MGLFWDLSKSSDLVDHDILLRKATRMGIRGVELKWFQSYLESSEQGEITYRCEGTNEITNYYHERDP
jgi:hypothetical protein